VSGTKETVIAGRTDSAARLFALWRRLEPIPGGRWVFMRLFASAVPYSGALGAQIVHLEPGRARVELPDRRRVRNHLRSIHAVAQANLAEMATGLALNSALPEGTRAILVRLSIDYVKKARGRLTAESNCSLPAIDEDVDVTVSGELRDPTGEAVSRVVAHWRVGPARR